MVITKLKLNAEDDHTVLSATIGDFDLWFRFRSDTTIRECVDPFVAAALLPAMLLGTDIEVDSAYSVSETLVNNLTQLQEVFSCWNKLFKVVRIHGVTSSVERGYNRIGAFFSGGVDSHHTFFRHRDSVTNLVVINGYDFEMTPEVFSNVIARIDSFGRSYGVATTPVETNFLDYGRHYKLMHTTAFGSYLGSVALALGYKRMYIPASHTYAVLSPEGSHPLTDRLWSNGAAEIIHDGASCSRVDKIRAFAHDQQVLDSLVVCWIKPNENCGQCSKCLRTMVTLRLLGLSSRTVPRMESYKALSCIYITKRIDLEFLQEVLDLAKERQDKNLIQKLSVVISKYYVRESIFQIDQLLLSGVLLKLYNLLGSYRRRLLSVFRTNRMRLRSPVHLYRGGKRIGFETKRLLTR